MLKSFSHQYSGSFPIRSRNNLKHSLNTEGWGKCEQPTLSCMLSLQGHSHWCVYKDHLGDFYHPFALLLLSCPSPYLVPGCSCKLQDSVFVVLSHQVAITCLHNTHLCLHSTVKQYHHLKSQRNIKHLLHLPGIPEYLLHTCNV